MAILCQADEKAWHVPRVIEAVATPALTHYLMLQRTLSLRCSAKKRVQKARARPSIYSDWSRLQIDADTGIIMLLIVVSCAPESAENAPLIATEMVIQIHAADPIGLLLYPGRMTRELRLSVQPFDSI